MEKSANDDRSAFIFLQWSNKYLVLRPVLGNICLIIEQRSSLNGFTKLDFAVFKLL
jgi:hypothetical protein